MLANHLKLALRTLRRRTSYALINGVGFTVGLACCALVVLFVRHELRYDRFHDRSEDVHRVLRKKRTNWWSTIPFPHYRDATAPEQRRLPRALAEQVPQIQSATNFYVGPHGAESPVYVEREGQRHTEDGTLYTTTGDAFFDVFTFDFLHGNAASALDAPNTVVLTAPAARRYFDSIDVVGETLQIHTPGRDRRVTVTGVIADVPPTSHFDFDLALQVDRIPNWGAYTYFRLRPGANTDGLASRIESIMNEVRPQRVEDPLLRSVLGGVRTQALTDIHLGPRMLYDQKPHRDMRYLWAFGALGLLILVIVGINYTNLAVALSTERSSEIGVRKAMGAHRAQVAGQFLAEATVLTGLCLPVVLGVLEIGVPVFNGVMNAQLRNDFLTSPGLLGGLVGLALLVGLAAGSYPAFILSRKRSVELFQNALQSGPGRRWSMRHVLIGLQFALLIGLGGITWIVNSQLHFLQTKDLGFQTKGTIELQRVDSLDTYRQLRARLKEHPEVEAVGAGVGPGPGRFHVTYRAEDSKQVHSDADVLMVDPGWFEVMDIEHPVVREMRTAGTEGTPRFLANTAAVRTLGYENPVGRTVVIAPNSNQPQHRTIDGAVDNFHFRPLYERVQPTFLRVEPVPQEVRSVLVRLDTQNLEAALRRVEAAWTAVRPNTPFTPTFVDRRLAQLYEEEQRIGQVGIGLTAIALLLAALGLVGLSAYVARRRTKEIGIRKALGATIPQIVMLLNREFAALVTVALVVAAPLAYGVAHEWLQSFAYRVEVRLWIFVGAGAGAVAVALAAVSYQAWQAAHLNPAEALQDE